MKYIMTLAVLVCSLSAFAQTNDPLLNQQYYIGAHNIDQVWNTTTGSSNTRIAIHSSTGFLNNHDDMGGSRFLSQFTNWFIPEKGFAQEVAGIIGANTNNGIGMAGINWNATMRSYNFLDVDLSSGIDQSYVFNADNVDYHFSVSNMNAMLDQAVQDNMDVQVFTFGVPIASKYKLWEFNNGNPSLNNYKLLTEGPSISTPQEAFWNEFQNAMVSMGTNIWNSITGNSFIPPTDLTLFRNKLWNAATQHNYSLIAAVGDKIDGRSPAPMLMPLAFDDFVIGVGGGEVSSGQTPIHWSGAGSSHYIDLVAAAPSISTLSGSSFNSYNSSFSSTQASAAIAAGVVSLLKTQNSTLSYDDFEHILKNTATDIEDPGKDDETGHGWLNAKAALDYINNNDIVRKTIPQNEIQVTYQNELSGTYGLENTYRRYSTHWNKKTIQVITGKINVLRGRVEFDYVFSSPPDVWLRNTSSGTDVSPIIDTQYYEPFEKNLKILSVDEYGFTFEMEYWSVEGRNSLGSLVDEYEIPDVENGNIYIDYTAVGDETNILNESPSVPQNLTVTAAPTGYGQPILDWDDNPESNIDYYKVYRKHVNVESSFNHIASPTSSSYEDWEVSMTQGNNEEFLYKVKAVNNINKESPFSNIVSVDGFLMNSKRIGDMDEPEVLPEEFAIKNNYPNPFNPATKIKYALPEAAEVTLKIFNIKGQEVATLVNTNLSAGFHEVTFDAGGLSSGMYIARMRATGNSGQIFTKELKMQLVK